MPAILKNMCGFWDTLKKKKKKDIYSPDSASSIHNLVLRILRNKRNLVVSLVHMQAAGSGHSLFKNGDFCY